MTIIVMTPNEIRTEARRDGTDQGPSENYLTALCGGAATEQTLTLPSTTDEGPPITVGMWTSPAAWRSMNGHATRLATQHGDPRHDVARGVVVITGTKGTQLTPRQVHSIRTALGLTYH